MNEKNIEKEKRTESITVYLTSTEKKDAQEKAKESKLSISGYFRFRGLSRFATPESIGTIEPIRRIKKVPTKEDPLMSEMRSGFSQVINEIKRGFKENRRFLRPIPSDELKEMQERKTERLKGTS